MITRIIEWSVRERLLVILCAALLSAMGIWAMLNTPVDVIPDLSDVQVIVKTEYPGQGPEVVETQVTYPLATGMLSVPHARTVRGFSLFGTSFVYVVFEDGTDLYWARSRVMEYLSQASATLPENARPVLGPDATGVGWIFQYALRDTSGTYDLAQLRSLQDFFLRYELQAVDGVSEVASVGGFEKQYQVVVDPQKLSAFGITLSQLRESLRTGNTDVGGRILEMAEREFIVRGRGYLRGTDDIRAVPLGSYGGTTVTIGDVATVRLGPQLRRGIAERNGEGEVVGGIVLMRHGENARTVIDRVKSRLAELESSLPSGVAVSIEYDRSVLISRAVRTLARGIGEELIVVALLVMLFLLHVRSAFVALLAVPIAVLMAMLLLSMSGLNANVMSLGGIAIAIGVLVDASIVMVETAHKRLERAGAGASRRAVITEAAREVGPSLFFSLLIVTVSFLPVLALENVEGRLFRPLVFTKTYAMAAASILAITLVPALMAVFLRGRMRSEARNPVAGFLARAYRPVLRLALRRPRAVVGASLVCMVLSLLPVQQLLLGRTFVPAPQIGSEFMPPLREGDMLYMPTMLPGVSPSKAAEVLARTNRVLMQFPEVASVFGKVGRAETATDPAPLSMIETNIALKDRSLWRRGMTWPQLVREFDEALRIPGLNNAWTMPIQGRQDMLATGVRTPVGVRITGPDLSELERIGTEIEEVLRPLAWTVYADRATGGSFLDIDVDRLEAARHGLTTADVLAVVESGLGGRTVTTSVEGLERYDINVRFARDFRASPSDLRQLLVPTSDGAVPLGQVARISVTDGPPVIKSENARRASWVYVDLAPGTDIGGFVSMARREVARRVELPPGYATDWTGRYEYLERANRRLGVLIPVTLAIIFLILLVHSRNLTEPLMLMTSLPFAVVGGIWLMAALDYQWSVAVAVGFIALAGLAAETGIVMQLSLRNALDSYRSAERPGGAGGVRAALEEGATERLRPLVMTVMTTLLALLPLMLSTGTGAEVMRRIATPMVGGLLSSAVLTLVLLPALYCLLLQRRPGIGNRRPPDQGP